MFEEVKCNICPRKCNADRKNSFGFCGQGDKVSVARAALHYGEEPCISGKNGSGAVFFSGCSLKCVFCQNHKLSKTNFGAEVSVKRLSEIFVELQEQGAENINLVTPTHFSPHIIKALELAKPKLKIPIVYNTGGYEKKETLHMLRDYVDIYLTDIKYFDARYAEKYSGAYDYPYIAFEAAEEMLSQKTLEFSEDGVLKRGVIIRHLVLPGLRKDSVDVVTEIKRRYGTEGFLLSLMSQYTPCCDGLKYPELKRRVTAFEYESVVDAAVSLGFKNGYTQDKSSTGEEYIPAFDLSGVNKE